MKFLINNKAMLKLYVILLIFNCHIDYAVSQYLKFPDFNKYKRGSEILGLNQYDPLDEDWKIYSNKDNLKIYQDRDRRQFVKKFYFMDKFKVLEISDSQIKVEDYNNTDVQGWANANEFILLPKAIRNDFLITHKAVLVNHFSYIKGEINMVTPLRSPTINAKKAGKPIKILEFAHIYDYFPNEYNPEFILIGTKPFFIPRFGKNSEYSIQQIIIGWIPANRILKWDTREGLEPNIKRENPIYYFKNKKDLISYYKQHKYDNKSPKKNLLVISPDNHNRIDKSIWSPLMIRYAILKTNNDPRNEPFEIGVATATYDEKILNTQTIKIIEEQKKRSNDTDAIFLIDATMSMDPYIELAGNIAIQIMKNFKKLQQFENSGDLRFGIALYRDYLNDKVFDYQNLTNNVNKLEKDLNNIKSVIKQALNPEEDSKKNDPAYYPVAEDNIDSRKADPAYYPEAVFQGLINSVESMNWKKDSLKLIIHIGDAGNNSRERDTFTEENVAFFLAQKDISYCALQIIREPRDEYEFEAQKLFNKQTRKIIEKIASIELAKLIEYEDSGLAPVEKNSRSKFMNLIVDAKDYDENDICKPCGDYRWQLRCIKPDQNNLFEKTLNDQIDEIVNNIGKVKNILDTIRMKQFNELDRQMSIKKISQNAVPEQFVRNNHIFEPFLLPGVVNKLINRVGEGKLIDLMETNNKEKIIKYIGKEKYYKMHKDPNIKKEVIKLIGKDQLKKYLQSDVHFFTKSYVMFNRPGKKYEKDPDQFIKKLLLQKSTLDKIISPIYLFKKKWLCVIRKDSIKKTWKDFLKSTLGEDVGLGEDEKIDKSKSYEAMYEQQFGISLRSQNPILKMTLSEIEQGSCNNKNIKELGDYLCNIADKLIEFSKDDDNYFHIFGIPYIWIDASLLP